MTVRYLVVSLVTVALLSACSSGELERLQSENDRLKIELDSVISENERRKWQAERAAEWADSLMQRAAFEPDSTQKQ